MAPDPRAAFDRFVAALEAHLEAVTRDRSDDSPAVIAAASTLIDAFETYDEALYDRYGVDTPFVVYDDSEEYEDEDEDEEAEDLEGDEGEDVGSDEGEDEDLETLEEEVVAPPPPPRGSRSR
jgi:hypothetical protein